MRRVPSTQPGDQPDLFQLYLGTSEWANEICPELVYGGVEAGD